MKRITQTLLLLFVTLFCFGQKVEKANLGQKFTLNFSEFKQNQSALKRKSKSLEISIPLRDGTYETFQLKESKLAPDLTVIKTYDGQSKTSENKLKLSVFDNKLEAIVATLDDYYFVEPADIASDVYHIYSLSETPQSSMLCGTEEDDFLKEIQEIRNRTQQTKSDQSFPLGANLRVFRFAASATGEMTGYYGSQAQALAQIVSITNLSNMIYEKELSISFRLIDKTMDQSLIFSNPNTDPFDPDPNFASAQRSQTGFTQMHNASILPYSSYDVGHTFSTMAPLASGSYSANGQAGPTPCVDYSKSRGWTQWTLGCPVGAIVGIFVHEVGHQFTAWHTYNANGGSAGSPTFCTSGWSNVHAVEPGSGSTLMGYANNCSLPVNQTLSGDNNMQYFHAKSIEAIEDLLRTPAVSCYTEEATGNTPPVANAGVDITIPKGTPFRLNGIATDADSDNLLYAWEQCDAATVSDRGALGHNIKGEGGYAAVHSTTAPLFRSERSYNTDRTFPKMKFILNNQNIPNDLDGEALPLVARDMTFRFVVRDQAGGLDMDEIKVTVSNEGPLQVASPNGGESWSANSAQTVTWNVNSTDVLSSTVDVLLSLDGGNTFAYTLVEDVPNNGSASVAVPNVPASTTARIKVVAHINVNAEFFDISDNDFDITSSCLSFKSAPCFPANLDVDPGDVNLDLSLVAAKPIAVTENFNFSIGGQSKGIYINESASSTNCHYIFNTTSSKAEKIRVAKDGLYTFTNETGGFLIISVFDSETQDCSSFLGSTAYWGGTGTSTSSRSAVSINLEACKDYYFYVINYQTTGECNVSVKGSGDVFVESAPPAGINYAYVAVCQTTKKITEVSETGDFRSLVAGLYHIYGLSYLNTTPTNALIGKTIEEVQGLACAVASANYMNVNIKVITSLETNENKLFKIYPTIVKDILHIEGEVNFRSLYIIDSAGQMKLQTNSIKNDQIWLGNLPSGSYLITLIDNEGKEYVEKIIKQ